MTISKTNDGQRYLIECHVFDGVSEDNIYNMYANTLEEAKECFASEVNSDVIPEIIDRLPDKLQLYVWEGFAPDYSDGLAFAIAKDEIEAREIIVKDIDWNPSNWGDLSIHLLDKSFGKAVGGGG